MHSSYEVIEVDVNVIFERLYSKDFIYICIQVICCPIHVYHRLTVSRHMTCAHGENATNNVMDVHHDHVIIKVKYLVF